MLLHIFISPHERSKELFHQTVDLAEFTAATMRQLTPDQSGNNRLYTTSTIDRWPSISSSAQRAV